MFLNVNSIILIIYLSVTSAQELCTTPINTPGNCILFKECYSLYNFIAINGRNLSKENNTYIRNSWCGVENRQHKICCPIENTATIRRRITTPSTTTQQTIPSTTKTLTRILKAKRNPEELYHPNMYLLPNNICGIASEDIRMTFSNKTLPFENPWMVIIQYKPSNNLTMFCGGTIINKRYILTAAHCLTKYYNPVSVVVGEHNRTSPIDCYPDTDDCAPAPITIGIENVFIHPKFHPFYYSNDIGLIRLNQDIDFSSDSVGPICLPITAEALDRELKRVKVTGWGKTEKDERSDTLLQAFLDIIPNDICKKSYPPRVKISERQMCTNGIGADSCNEDSGGPASFLSLTPYGLRYVQFGIISAGQETCGTGPGLYCKVGSYIKWILDTIY